MQEPQENIPEWENHLIKPLAKLMKEKGISDLQITLKDGKAIYVLDPANDPSGVRIASTYTKSYVSSEFGDTSAPLECITLKAGDRELAMLPLREIVHMADELRDEIERYRMEHRPDTRHRFAPNKNYPWFCAHCGYPPEHPVIHLPADAGGASESQREADGKADGSSGRPAENSGLMDD
jgi:hypothetical protein